MVTEIQRIRSTIDNFKLGRIVKIISFSERKKMVPLHMFIFFENFTFLLMGGHDEKLENFGKLKKKSVILTNYEKNFCNKID